LWLARKGENNKAFVEELGLGTGFDMGIACWPVYQMLFGMSFELMLKAIIVVKGNEPKHSHNLIELARETEIDFTDLECDVLKILTESIRWEGRYPVPKKKEILEEHYEYSWNVLSDKKSIGNMVVRSYNGSLDWERIDMIWYKAKNRFFALYHSNT